MKERFILIRKHSLQRVESRYKAPYGYRKVAERHAEQITAREKAQHINKVRLYGSYEKPEAIVVMSTSEYANRISGMGEWKKNLLNPNGPDIWVAFDTPAVCDPSTETYHSF